MSAAPGGDAPLPPLRDVIREHRLSADKRFGQHFLLDLNLTARIARAAGALARGTTIEVGQPADLVVVERDPLQSTTDELHGMPVFATLLGGRTTYGDMP